MALSSNVVWEVRTTGSSDNGGGFSPYNGIVVSLSLANPGENYLQNDIVNIDSNNQMAAIQVDSVDTGGEILTWHLVRDGYGYTTGIHNSVNGTGSSSTWNITEVTNSTDYSQQDSAQLSLTDGTMTENVIEYIDSVTGGFTNIMKGNLIYISSGTNVDIGYYQILEVVSSNKIRVSGNVTSNQNLSSSDICFKIGGALDHPIRIADILDQTSKMYIKKGIYTYISHSSQACLFHECIGLIEGYDAVRGDAPNYQTNQPILDCNFVGSFGCRGDLSIVRSVAAKNFITYGFYGATSLTTIDCSANFNATISPGSAGFMSDADLTAINCVASSTDWGFYFVLSDSVGTFINCEADSCNYGFFQDINTTAKIRAINCIAAYNDVGFHGKGIFMNCVALSSTTTGFKALSNQTALMEYFDYNCYYNNGTNLDGIVAGAHDISTDPKFVDPLNYDFRLQSTSPLLGKGSPQGPLIGTGIKIS